MEEVIATTEPGYIALKDFVREARLDDGILLRAVSRHAIIVGDRVD